MKSSFVNVFVKTIDGGTSTAKKSSSKALVISQADQRLQSTLTAEREDSKLEQCTSCNRTSNFLHLVREQGGCYGHAKDLLVCRL